VEPVPSIHNYGIDDNPLDEQSALSDEENDPTNLQIRNNPVQPMIQLMQESSKGKDISLTIPKQTKQTVATVKSTTSTKPPTQQTIQQITLQLANMTTTQTAQTSTTTVPTTSQTTVAATTAMFTITSTTCHCPTNY